MQINQNYQFQQFNQALLPQNNLASFAYTNAILRSIDQLTNPLLHFWTLKQTVILGLKDQRLPHIEDARQFLSDHGYHSFMRNSGGLAVVSDDGILNLSLFIPWQLLGHELTIDTAYQQMVDLIQAAFPELTIHTGEIVHSYCPGNFDISVAGQKIGGISQRRNQHGVVVMLYLSVNGDQQARGALIRDFYQRGLQAIENKWHFPDVWPTSMTTIADLLHQQISINDAITRIQQACQLTSSESFNNLLWSQDFNTTLTDEFNRITNLQARLKKED